MPSPILICGNNVNLGIFGLPEDVKKEIQTKTSFYIPGYKFMPKYKQQLMAAKQTGIPPAWDGTKSCSRRIDNGGLRVPSGLLSYVYETLREHGLTWEMRDERNAVTKSTGWSIEGMNLYNFQTPVKNDMLNIKRGVVKMATGGGKTPVAMAAIIEAAAFPAMFYVPSCDLLEQTHTMFTNHCRLNGLPVEIGRIGSGHCDIRAINIATIQSCQLALEGKFDKFDDESDDSDKAALSEKQKKDIQQVVKEAQFVAADECQHTSCETIQSIMNNSFSARYRFGLSASPWRDDGLDILIEACFGKRLCDIDASFLIDQGFLVRPFITFNHFQQHLGPIGNYNACYTKYVVENEGRNRWIAERAMTHIKAERPTVILVKWSKHAEILADMIPGAEVLTSSGKLKKTPLKRKDILDKMRERKVMCIIGTTLLDEGVDIPCAGTGIFAGGGKSSTRALQRVGRFVRVDKNDAAKTMSYIEEFYDHVRFLDHHARARRKILLTERNFAIRDNRDTTII